MVTEEVVFCFGDRGIFAVMSLNPVRTPYLTFHAGADIGLQIRVDLDKLLIYHNEGTQYMRVDTDVATFTLFTDESKIHRFKHFLESHMT
ncbi:hypothetical protein BST95_09035 [Halioglobus japonicus]|uniref:Uncharacterized protein n=1 Tax=Halioglobus japonicus TaxID=930805 RepID=A0AAP8SNQ9_9GAMM|nr:hypothetical protein BST95_09035 [Halioglobus japonicus]PLW86373.1 hypothetical protein C0029_08075 [Halioglobus japonicus]GHD13221.1 hypothetical protein GCM10007052_15110 [Halioglobus japonicus]